MTPDRVGEMRRLAESLQTFMHGKPSRALSECLNEIERLQSLLQDSRELQSVADKIVEALEEFADKLDNLTPDE